MPSNRSIQLLVVTLTLIVALVFAVAGVQKLRLPDPTATMIGRYVDSPQGVRAIGCMEIGMALWLLSFRTPRLAGGAAAIALIGFSVMIAVELNRGASALPCGCLETRPGLEAPHAIRRGLWISLARNGFLILCATGAAWLATPDKNGEMLNSEG